MLLAKAQDLGLVLRPEHRACAFSVSDGTTRGLIEVCPVG
jgi:hypothetical protein